MNFEHKKCMPFFFILRRAYFPRDFKRGALLISVELYASFITFSLVMHSGESGGVAAISDILRRIDN